MDPEIKRRYGAKALIMKALAHPTRLFLLDELSKGPRCVCDLTRMVGDDISTVSKHLFLLKTAGIITDEKKGAQVFYSLRVRCALDFFSCLESVLKTERGKFR